MAATTLSVTGRLCFGVLPDSSLCQNGKQVEIITKMIFELCYIEVIISNGGLLFQKIIRNTCLWALRIDVLCYFVFYQTAIICFIS